MNPNQETIDVLFELIDELHAEARKLLSDPIDKQSNKSLGICEGYSNSTDILIKKIRELRKN